jgi:AcrR family transcriptional regulator
MCARPANPELRARILKAATAIVEDCGPDCVTMRQVADEIGYSPTTLYLYFKDKHAILTEIVVEGFEDLADFCLAAQVGPTPLDKLRQRARAYIVWGLLHPGLYQLMFEARIETDFTPEQGQRLRRGIQDGVDLIPEAVAAGQLSEVGDAAEYGNAAWAALHGVTSLAISRRLVPGAAGMGAKDLLDAATQVGSLLMDSLISPHGV